MVNGQWSIFHLNRRIRGGLLLFFLFPILAVAQTDSLSVSIHNLHTWTAGTTVTADAVASFGGMDSCFVAMPIPDDVWQRMQGKTYKPNPHIARSDLRYLRLLHTDYDHKIHLGEMVCNRQIADRLLDIFRQLYEAGYPIQRIVLPDDYDADDERQMRANNTSCFCYRSVSGSKKLSAHARGMAVDLNPFYNPYYIDRKDGTRFVQPATARQYCNRNKQFPYKIDKNDLAYRLFTRHGFAWGGSWRTCKDYQHFQLRE